MCLSKVEEIENLIRQSYGQSMLTQSNVKHKNIKMNVYESIDYFEKDLQSFIAKNRSVIDSI